MRRQGIIYSAIIHLLLVVLMIFGLPEIFARNHIAEPSVVTVEILPVSEKSNVKPQAAKPKPQKKKPQKKKPVEEKKVKKPKKPVPKVKTSTPPPAPKPKAIPHPDKKPKKPVKTQVKKPKPKKPEKLVEDDLEAVLKSVARTAREYEKKSTAASDATSRAKSDNYDPSQPLTLSEKDLIRNQLKRCWNVPAGARDAHKLVVFLRVRLNPDASLLAVELAADKARYNSDSFFRAAADSAIRAVQRCTPLRGLPPEKYSRWKDMELTFDPKEMLF